MLLALALASPTLAGDLVQTDVALVRAAPRDDAAVLTRLPINTEVEVVDRTASAQGYVAVRVSNAETVGLRQSLTGFIRSDLLGERVTVVRLERMLSVATGPDERLPLLERLVALRGDAADLARLVAEAEATGDAVRTERARALAAPAPTVIGVCRAGHVAVLAEIRDGRLVSLVEEVAAKGVDAPEVKAAERRLRERALRLTTRRFYRYHQYYWPDSGFLVLPSVVTRQYGDGPVYVHIELGDCPVHRSESGAVPGILYATTPMEPARDLPELRTADITPLLHKMPGALDTLEVVRTETDLVELDTAGGNWVFDRQTHALRACSFVDVCPDRLITYTERPMWAPLSTGERLRVASVTEDVSRYGWGIGDGSDTARFVIQLYGDRHPPREIGVTLEDFYDP